MKLGVMCSGNGTNFENILRTCSKDEVVLMITNNRRCGAVKRAKNMVFLVRIVKMRVG